ncbi:MAG: complex I subunit 5 family protein [bacterium]
MLFPETINPITLQESYLALLPILIIAAPLLGAILVSLVSIYNLPNKNTIRNIIIIASCLTTITLSLILYHPVIHGLMLNGVLYKGIDLALPFLFGLSLHFGVDNVGLIFVLITAIMWTLAATFGTSYMVNRHAKGRFFTFYLGGLASCLGIYLVKDFFSLFIFFEFVTLTCYCLVAHDEVGDSIFAGKLFIYISVIGGLSILFATILLYGYSGNVSFYPSLANTFRQGDLGLRFSQGIRFLIFSLFILGFGIKAGLWLVHIWLPVAHPVAPPPAHAVLSGLVVKVGIYGILRSIYRLYPVIEIIPGHVSTVHIIGIGIIWLGVLTMFFGMLPALLTTHLKRMFAFSTVSQMGFIVFGLGCALLLGTEGAMGVAGALYYAINHAVYKSAFFLCIGIICSRTDEVYLEKMGGMWQNMPITALTYFFAMLSIAGIPFTGGFASKTMVHHAITEAITHFEHLHLNGLIGWLKWANWMFMISAAGTFCYASRSFYMAFMGKRPEHLKEVKPETKTMRVVFITMIAFIILVGLFPNFLLEKLVGPALTSFGFNINSHAYELIYNTHTGRSALPLLYDPLKFTLGSFFSHEVVHNVIGVGIISLITIGWYLLGIYGRMFKLTDKIPAIFNLKNWYVHISRISVIIFSQLCSGLEFILDKGIAFVMVYFWLASSEQPIDDEG